MISFIQNYVQDCYQALPEKGQEAVKGTLYATTAVLTGLTLKIIYEANICTAPQVVQLPGSRHPSFLATSLFFMSNCGNLNQSLSINGGLSAFTIATTYKAIRAFEKALS
jgi:hypothetical protein